MTTLTDTDLEEYRALLDQAFDQRVVQWAMEAERSERFPRQLIEHLGRCGVFTQKWGNDAQPNVAKLVELAFGLGRLNSMGVGVGVSLHDSAISVLRRFGRSDYLRDICEGAIAGDVALCIAASEESGGSDLQIVETEIHASNRGFAVRGTKKFVSLAPIADHIVVVVRGGGPDSSSRHGNVALVCVPTDQVKIAKPYRKVGAGPLDTAAVHIDTWVPADAMIARPGTGLAAISWGLAHERMSIAGQIATSTEQMIGITLARMVSRKQFGSTLFQHQALRMRMADLQTRVHLLHHGLIGLAATGKLDLRAAAAVKVTAARLGEEVASECMHIFGGSGYLTEETDVNRWWRDMKLARVGGGTDEVLWELVAAAMKPDHDGYREMVARSKA